MKERTIYALGFFDGVHLGHQALLSACKELAMQENCAAGVITFDAHPDTLVLGKTPALINTPNDRALLLKNYGMETVIALPFDKAMMEMPWQEFFRMLVKTYHAAGIVCGSDSGSVTGARATPSCFALPAKKRISPAPWFRSRPWTAFAFPLLTSAPCWNGAIRKRLSNFLGIPTFSPAL